MKYMELAGNEEALSSANPTIRNSIYRSISGSRYLEKLSYMGMQKLGSAVG